MSDLISSHYDDQYFDWQAPIGEFGGWANQTKFIKYKPNLLNTYQSIVKY